VGNVFICHAPNDIVIADEICEVLEHDGIDCWISSCDIPPGGNYGVETARGIRECDILLLVFSNNANDSGAVLREVRMAYEANKVIIPLSIQDADISEDLNFYLEESPWMDADVDGHFYNGLIRHIKHVLNSRPMNENEDAWKPARTSSEPVISRKAIFATAGGIALFLVVSLAFFFITGGVDEHFEYEPYVSVYLDVNDTRLRVDIDSNIRVLNVVNFDWYGRMLLDGHDFRQRELGVTIFSLINLALDQGIMRYDDNVSVNIQPRRVRDSVWLDRVEEELGTIFQVLNQ